MLWQVWKNQSMILAFIQSFDNGASHWENNNETDPVIFGKWSESVMVLLQKLDQLYWLPSSSTGCYEYNTQDVNLECMCKGLAKAPNILEFMMKPEAWDQVTCWT